MGVVLSFTAIKPHSLSVGGIPTGFGCCSPWSIIVICRELVLAHHSGSHGLVNTSCCHPFDSWLVIGH